jgi:hypothetical protein
MWLENKTDANIDRVAITIYPVNLAPLPAPHIRVNQLNFAGGQTTLVDDPPLGFYLYKLPQPLPPHGRISLTFAVEYDNRGFENSRPNTTSCVTAHSSTTVIRRTSVTRRISN